MGIYDRDYMRLPPPSSEDLRPTSWTADAAGLLKELTDSLPSIVGICAAVFFVGWLVSGGSEAWGAWHAVHGVRWLPVGLVSMGLTLLVGAGDPGALRSAIALLLGLLAAFAYYAWVMGRLGYDVLGLMLEHEAGGPGSAGIVVYQLLVHATPWWLLILSVLQSGWALTREGAYAGCNQLGMATLLVSGPYLVAKILTEVVGMDLFD